MAAAAWLGGAWLGLCICASCSFSCSISICASLNSCLSLEQHWQAGSPSPSVSSRLPAISPVLLVLLALRNAMAMSAMSAVAVVAVEAVEAVELLLLLRSGVWLKTKLACRSDGGGTCLLPLPLSVVLPTLALRSGDSEKFGGAMETARDSLRSCSECRHRLECPQAFIRAHVEMGVQHGPLAVGVEPSKRVKKRANKKTN
jgi:hypothetical protein